ncbi:hypothetical protein ID866_4471 [Astraeus odoratus]|nr:hypothetical protein ID866_4471 [Astraeus odoratus]
MFLFKSWLSFILLALSGVNMAAGHIAKMPVPADSLHIDQLGKRDGSVFVQKNHEHYYCVTLITSSQRKFKVAVDTASAYTWVGAIQQNPYVEGFASHATGVSSHITYAGQTIVFDGETYDDSIALGDLIINPQGIGVPIELRNFPADLDGILGLGRTIATYGIGSDGKPIPTVVDNLYSQGAISSPLLGVYFMPENVGGNGILSFGSIRESVLTSDVKYIPVTTTPPANFFWGVDATIKYGDNMLLPIPASGILDTGTDNIAIPSDAFSAYQSATGGLLHRDSGWLIITQAQYDQLQTLSFLIGGESYDLSPNAQIRPRPSPNFSLMVLVFQKMTSPDIAFSLGIPFFQRYYVVFNSSSNEIGFARHIHTESTSN